MRIQEMSSPPSRAFWIVAALIILGGFGLRIWQLGDASLWYDEAFTALVMEAPADRFFTLMFESSSAHVPLYFMALRPFHADTEVALRLPSVVLGVLGIPLLMWVTVRLYRNYKLALAAGALLAFNPYHIWLSRTARPYALVFVLAVLASYFFLMLLSRERTRANWIGFTLSSAALYFTHYFALALPLAQYVLFAFILRTHRGFFRRWFYAQAIAIVPMVLWLIGLMQQETVSFGVAWIPTPGLPDLPLTLWNMLVGYDGSLPWYIVPGLIASAAGLIPGAYHAIRERKTYRIDFYWFWLVVAPLLAIFAVSLFRPVYVDRYFMISLPAVLLLTVRGWQRLSHSEWALALAVIVAVVGAGSVIIALERDDDVKEDWRAAAQYVEQSRAAGDGLLLEDPITLVAFLRYLEDDRMPRAWLLDGPAWTSQYAEPVERVWAIYRNPNEDGHIQGVLPNLDPFEPTDLPLSAWLIERRAQVIEQKAFNGVTVLLVDVAAEFAEVKP